MYVPLGLPGTVVHWVNGSATFVDCSSVPVPVQVIVNCPFLKTTGLNAGGTDPGGAIGFWKSIYTKLNSASRSGVAGVALL